MKTKEEILDVVFGPDTDYKYKPFPDVKKAMQEFADQELTEYRRKLKEDARFWVGPISQEIIFKIIDTTQP